MFYVYTLQLLPTFVLASCAVWARVAAPNTQSRVWRLLNGALWLALGGTLAHALVYALDVLPMSTPMPSALESSEQWLKTTTFGMWMTILVQSLGLVIGLFSKRYLQGERDQSVYVAAFATVLALVHLLLLANHWVVLIPAWAGIGLALRRLLCFYPNRPFAVLASHKKTLSDLLADGLLIAAAAGTWFEVGSGEFVRIFQHVELHGSSALMQFSTVCLVLAVILRTALLPVHGWLIQVMEAPTPVSALLHAGVVNLGGYVLIAFAPLLTHAPAAQWLLVVFGLSTALLAGLVMLTRVSIKVKLAWSTVAQMGFMVLECGLGLYTLAALHLVGHSLYKAHAFLAASSVVQVSKASAIRGQSQLGAVSFVLAPAISLGVVFGLQSMSPVMPWPLWWSSILALAWSPLLWLPALSTVKLEVMAVRLATGIGSVIGLTSLTLLAHWLPFGVTDLPHQQAGWLAFAGMLALYLTLGYMNLKPDGLSVWRRWTYAGFYIDEIFTRLALSVWPKVWNQKL